MPWWRPRLRGTPRRGRLFAPVGSNLSVGTSGRVPAASLFMIHALPDPAASLAVRLCLRYQPGYDLCPGLHAGDASLQALLVAQWPEPGNDAVRFLRSPPPVFTFAIVRKPGRVLWHWPPIDLSKGVSAGYG